MLSRSWVRYVAAGLIALCVTAAVAHDNPRVRVNDEILECRPPNGCFVVETYVVERQPPLEITINDNRAGANSKPSPQKSNENGNNLTSNTVVEIEPSTDGNNDKTDDVEGQEDQWAWALRFLAFVNAISTILLPFATIGLLYNASRQSGIMRDSLNEARQTAADNRKSLEAQVSFLGLKFALNVPANAPYLELSIFNSGNTKAVNIKAEITSSPVLTVGDHPRSQSVTDRTIQIPDTAGNKMSEIKLTFGTLRFPVEVQQAPEHLGGVAFDVKLTGETSFGDRFEGSAFYVQTFSADTPRDNLINLNCLRLEHPKIIETKNKNPDSNKRGFLPYLSRIFGKA